MWDTGRVQINKISMRRRAGDMDPLLSRQRLTSLLQAADLQPGGLPASAILCVRKLLDPLPESLRLRSDSAGTSLEWEQKVSASLERMARSAARPARESVPASAEAIVFFDRAELLVCLANDWCDGCVSDRWWWRSLFKTLDSRSMVLHAWLDAAEYAPAALEQLALKGTVLPFVRTLNSSDTRAVLQTLTDTFAMPELAASVAHIPDYFAIPGIVTSHDSAASGSSERISSAPPWQRWVPECSGSGLTPLQQYLLGVGLTLARAPRAVRAVAFADGVRSWCQGADNRGRSEVSAPSADEISNPLPARDMSEPAAAESLLLEAGASRPDAPPPPGESITDTSGVLVQQRVERQSAESIERIHPPELLQETPAAGTGEQHDAPPTQRSDFEQSLPRLEDRADTASLRDVSINTELGGLFYLINLGIFLNLYGDFTRPLQPGITLDIWDFVTLIGRHLLGEAGEADPLWPLLARLSGRSDTEPAGSGFQPPDLWQLPAEWLLPFPESGNWKWSTTDRRLRVRHWDGFLLLDQPLVDGDHREQVRQATEAYGPVVPFRLERGATERTDKGMSLLDRWLHRLVPYLHARLKRGLCVTEVEQISPLLCRNSARISVSAAQVDVFFALDEHPIEIRLAGLDRNPGWVPAAGRFIAFHYE